MNQFVSILALVITFIVQTVKTDVSPITACLWRHRIREWNCDDYRDVCCEFADLTESSRRREMKTPPRMMNAFLLPSGQDQMLISLESKLNMNENKDSYNIDMSTMLDARPSLKDLIISTTTTTTTTTTTITTITTPGPFRGGQRRGIVLDVEEETKDSTETPTLIDGGYSRQLCLDLKVPCRFVSDHPCCDYAMPLDLVARARSMDGSADLIWRSQSSSPFLSEFEESARSLNSNRKTIHYDYATSSDKVRIPDYIFEGFGLEVTSNLIGNCWRMSMVTCTSSKRHPCCRIRSSASGPPTLNRVSRWLSLD